MLFPASGSLAGLLALAMVMGCGHTEPFTTAPTGSNQPFDPTPPIRLTFNRAPDRDGAWLPDGSAILYSTQPAGRPDHDICLAVLPPGGGRQRSLTCDAFSSPGALTDAIESPAPAPDGRLAFFAATGSVGAALPNVQALALASVIDPATRRSLLSIPYAIPGGRVHGGISQLRWLGSNRLLYLGEAVVAQRACASCALDTIRTGQDAVWLAVDATGALPQAIPGTDYASGVSPGSNEDEVYYTLGGDTRVYRRILSSGTVSVAHDFGSAGIVRDVHVVGTRMAAVVGGRVVFAVDPSLGPTQWDSGGTLHLVDLQNGSDSNLDGPGLFRRPQLSPSGTAIVAEVYPLISDPVTDSVTVSRNGDLYLFGQP
jgi:WD40 repeat protein